MWSSISPDSFTKRRSLECWVKFLSHCAPKEGRSEGIRGCWSALVLQILESFWSRFLLLSNFWNFGRKFQKNASLQKLRSETWLYTLKFEHKAAGRGWPTQQSSLHNPCKKPLTWKLASLIATPSYKWAKRRMACLRPYICIWLYGWYRYIHM